MVTIHRRNSRVHKHGEIDHNKTRNTRGLGQVPSQSPVSKQATVVARHARAHHASTRIDMTRNTK